MGEGPTDRNHGDARHHWLSPGRAARTVLIAIGLVGLTALLWQARDLLFVVFFAVLVAVFLSVFVDPLVSRGAPRVVAVVAVLVAVLALLFLGSWLLWPTISEQFRVVAEDLPAAAEESSDWLRRQYDSLRESLGAGDAEMGEVEEEVRARLREQAMGMISGALPVLNSVIGAVAGALVVLMGGIYMAANPRLYREGLLRLVPPRHRGRVADALARSATSLRQWMIGTVLNMLIVGTLVTVGLWILGVPAPVALGVIAGLLEFVPIFGPIFASVPAIIIGFAVSPAMAVWVAVLYTVIQQIEGNLVTPLVMRGAAELPPALTLLFQVFMGIIFGFLGLFLAVPILAATMPLVNRLYVEEMEARSP